MDSGFPKKTPTPRLLQRERLQPNTLLPSKFQQEKFLSTKKEASTGGRILPRIGPWLDLSETRPKLPSAPPKQNLLQISPPEVIFQNFNTHDVSEMTVSLMNVDKFPHVVKVSMERSPYFQVMGSNDAYRLLVPGASVPVHIRFTPDENKDYSHELICVTEREKIVVPIRAIAARVILDFPEQLDFSTCPVKCSTQQTVLLRNSGNLEAHFQLSTQSPFSVVPQAGVLGAGDTREVTVEFHPLTTGDHSGSLHCSTGEETIHTNLRGEAVDNAVNAELSTNFVAFEKTFITMSSHATVFIENRSSIPPHFQWKTFPAKQNKKQEKRRLV